MAQHPKMECIGSIGSIIFAILEVQVNGKLALGGSFWFSIAAWRSLHQDILGALAFLRTNYPSPPEAPKDQLFGILEPLRT